jgi:hypothetical protein
VSGTVFVGGAGAVFGVVLGVCGTGVCGTPEPGFGVAGLDCDQTATVDTTKKKIVSKTLGERCIEFKKLLILSTLNNTGFYQTRFVTNHLDAGSSSSDGRPV